MFEKIERQRKCVDTVPVERSEADSIIDLTIPLTVEMLQLNC